MSGLVDGLLLYLNLGQIGNYSRSIFDNLIKYSNLHFNILKDYEINSGIYNSHEVEILIDRVNNNYLSLSNYLNSTKTSFFHCLNNGFSIPKNFNFNYILTVSNLMPLFIEDICSDNYNINFFNKFPYSILQSDYIICPSISCKNDLLKNFSMDESKIFINYGLISEFYTKRDSFMSNIYLKSKFNISNKYIIFYGDFHRRKNLEKTLVLFNKLKKHIKDLNFLICSDNFNDKKYLNELKILSNNLGIYESIVFIDNPSLMDKVNLFNNALLFIDLSIYENVNLNIVEAFSMGVPILCSYIPLYREYLGDCCFYDFDNISISKLIDYILNFNINNLDFVLDKFDKSLNINIMSTIYNKFS